MPIVGQVQVERLADIFQALEDIPGAVEASLEDVAKFVRSLAIGRSPEASGAFGTSWGQIEEAEGGYSFTNPLPYAHVLEFGLYPGLGPRTTPGPDAGIYSRQAREGVVRPILEESDTAIAVATAVAEELERRLSL